MKKNRFKIKLNFKKGFSIGEVMLSVFILGVTMISILSLYSQGLRYFQDERDSVIAAMLAQEGVELARNIRDNNWARRVGVDNSTNIGTFDNFDVTSGNRKSNCRVSFDSKSLTGGEIIYSPGVTCTGASYVLNVDGNGFYTHASSGTTATKFRRKIILDYRDGENLIVISLATWNNANLPDDISECTVENKCVFSQTTLTEWGTGT